VNACTGYRLRDWDTRVGSVDLAIPKLRQESYFPKWLAGVSSSTLNQMSREGGRIANVPRWWQLW